MNRTKKYVALILTLLMVFGIFPAAAFAVQADDAADTDIRYAYTAQENAVAVDPDEWVTVIVELDGETTLDRDDFVAAFQQSSKGFSADKTVAAYREQLVQQHENVAAQISAVNSEAGFRYHYTNILNGFAATVQRKDIDAIKAIEGVLNVYECQTYMYDKDWQEHEQVEAADLALSDSGSIMQLDLEEAWEEGYSGAGKVVAIFDSSLRYTHALFNYMDPEIAAAKPGNFKTKEGLLECINANKDTINLFNSDWGSWFHGREETGFDEATQAAIAAGDFWHNDKVPFAVDYFDGDLEVWDGDTSSHGTHVSGIAAGNGGPDFVSDVRGAAKDAQIMFFKIFSEYDDFAQESDEAVFAALDDAVTLGANSFNLSLGIDFGFSTMQSYAQGGYQKAYNRAQAAGISVAVSAGNSARTIRNSSMVNAGTTILPNKYSVGFSGSMFGPMTVASAAGAGYVQYGVRTTATFTDAEGEALDLTIAAINDNNAVALGQAAPGSYELVDVGLASEAEILEATGAETLEGALAGKAALVTRGDLTYLEKGENCLKAGAAALVMINSQNRASALSAAQIFEGMPSFGMISPNAGGAALQAAVAEGTVMVSFASEDYVNNTVSESKDTGPSSFTSWGVTEALNLKPDVMTPGGSIWSAGASSDTALATMSGTSMASPNMCGSFIPVQQYVDANLDVFGVKPGTQEYSNLVNQLVASNTKVYARAHTEYTEEADAFKADAYHSPRRQGAGMPQIGDITKSKVVLHSNVDYDPVTGEAPRTKVDLFDKLGDTFDITFTLENYNDAERTFAVKANVQTDATVENAGRDVIAGSSDNNAFSFNDAVITVGSVSGDATVSAGKNINEFAAEGFEAASVTVPAKSSTVVTVTVQLNADTMKTLDAHWPNGMFLEGFIFFSSEANENVSIPYMGFRGDWNQAPIFDFDSIYDDYSEKTTADLDYPLYAVTSLATYLPDGTEALLGANQFSGTALPDFYQNGSYARVRSYVKNLADAGLFSGDFAAFSPNGDGFDDCLFANLALLRHAKALCVEIVDAEGNVVATVGPDYDYFLAYQNDGLLVQQIAQTQDGPYSHTMGWDGKGADGKVVADGDYTYKVYAITEYQYLKDLKGETADPDAAKVLQSLKANGQTFEMNFKVDTTAPKAVVNAISDDGVWNVALTDESGIQAVAVYYNGVMVGDVNVIVTGNSCEAQIDVKDLVLDKDNANKALFESGNFDVSKVSLQALDFAFNRAVIAAEPTVEPPVDPGKCDGGDNCPSKQLTDVDRGPDSWYHEAVDWAFVEGITTGKTDSLFAPEDACTREQVVTFLWRAAGEPKPTTTENPFTDVTEGYSYDAILWAVEKGITNGTSKDTFSPKATCTREQIVTFLWRYENQPAPTSTVNPFSDVKEGYAYNAILWAVENGITNGMTATTFEPAGTCTRAQIVTFLFRDIVK